MIIIGLFLIFLVLSIFLSWYSINCLRKIQFMMESVKDLDKILKNFDEHLKGLYEMEMYYGDQTLHSLIQHSKEVVKYFESFRDDYKIFSGEINENEFFDQEEAKDDATKEKETR